MIKILLILPYSSLHEDFERYIAYHDTTDIEIEIQDIYGTESDAIRNNDASIIVARGLTGQAIRKEKPDVHFIEIAITSYDLINALVECKKRYGNVEVALVLSVSMNVQALEDIMGMSIRQYQVSNEKEINDALHDIRKKGIREVVGGMTVCSYCKSYSLHSVYIQTGLETIELTVKEAINTARTLRHERTKANLLRTLLDNSKEAIVAANANGMVMAFNQLACQLFQREPGVEKPVTLKDLLPDSGWLDEMQRTNQSEALQAIGNQLMLVNRLPIIVDERETAVLLMFQNTEEIRETESRIRKQLRSQGLVAKYGFHDIIGEDESMLRLVNNAIKFSKVDTNVLIVGESGTGKEMFAQSIHNTSKRSAQPFVAVNCAALPEQLLESELFGYAEGAFSGASRGGKIGLFEQAHRGTIFLDEIGEIPLPVQAKLLRVLQEKELRRIGDNKVVPVDVRIISATNINFPDMVKKGQFRLDLYYRINLLNLHIPALRQHTRDIPALFHGFLTRYMKKAGLPVPHVANDAIDMLMAHTWPGNVRELQNLCERLAVLGCSDIIDADTIHMAGLSDSIDLYTPAKSDRQKPASDEQLLELLLKKRETKAEMAKRLGVSRSTLWRKLKAVE